MRTTLIHFTKSSCKEARKLLLSRILAWEQKGALTTLATRGRIALGVMALLLIGGSLAYAACMVYAVVATIPAGPAGSFPFEVGVNPITNRIYVSNILSDSLFVIDGTTDNVVATIPITRPSGVAVNPSTNRVYVVSGSSSGNIVVRVIDGTNNSDVATIPVPGRPSPIAVNTTTNRIYVVDSVGNVCCPQPDSTVYVIDGNTNSIVASATVGKQSFSIGVNPSTNRIYVGNALSGTVSVIDGGSDSVIDTIPLIAPFAIGVNPATNRVYVARPTPVPGGSSLLFVIDGATDAILATIPVPAVDVTRIAVDPTANRIYITSLFTDIVTVLDGATNAIVATVPTPALGPSGPVGVGVNPTTNRIYVADSHSDNVSVIGLVTPQQAVQLLIDHVNRLVASGALTQNQGDALKVTLNLAKEKLTAGDIQGAMTALKLLDNAFVNKVNALINSGNLTQAQGQDLINEANSLISQLGC